VVECVSHGEVLCSSEVAATLFRRAGELARETGLAPIGTPGRRESSKSCA
jgi:hypothetical protein